MHKEDVKFLFVGPLFSIFKKLHTIRRDIVGLQDTVDSIAARLADVSVELAKGFAEVRNKISELEAQVAAGETVDFSAVNAALDTVAGQAEALDNVVPDAVSEPEPEAPAADEEIV